MIHFLLLGGALFTLEVGIIQGPSAADERVIRVDEAAVIGFVGDQTNSTQASALNQWRALDTSAKRRVVDDFVREEALYRKAISFGLDQGDYVIRRRLVQKMEFAGRTFSDDPVVYTDAQLETYYQNHLNDFLEPASVTFTHVFYEGEQRGFDGARDQAQATLEQLEQDQISFDQSGRFGERFAYHRNYVDQSEALVEGHFGANFARALFSSTIKGKWQGPLISEQGAHLVLILSRSSQRTLALSEVRARIVSELAQQSASARATAFEDRLLSEFVIRSDLDSLDQP